MADHESLAGVHGSDNCGRRNRWRPAPARSRAGGQRCGFAGRPRRGSRLLRAAHSPCTRRACFRCHSAKAAKPKGKLRLDSAVGLRNGGEKGEGSRAQQARRELAHLGIALPVERDAAQGQAARCRHQRLREVDLDGGGRPARPKQRRWRKRTKRQPKGSNPRITGRSHGRIAPRRHTVDAPADARNDVDRFILARLEAKGLSPSAQAADRAHADPPARVRPRRPAADARGGRRLRRRSRATLRYEASRRPLARLAPRFGERWGRHWLDVARYADTKGYVFEEDRSYPLRLHLPRLGHRQLQRRPAVRPVRHRADRRRPARRQDLRRRRWASSRSAGGS